MAREFGTDTVLVQENERAIMKHGWANVQVACQLLQASATIEELVQTFKDQGEPLSRAKIAAALNYLETLEVVVVDTQQRFELSELGVAVAQKLWSDTSPDSFAPRLDDLR